MKSLNHTLIAAALMATLALAGCKKEQAAEPKAETKAAPVQMKTAEEAKKPVVVSRIETNHAFIREMPPGAKVAGGFVQIANQGNQDDRLVAIRSGFAKTIEIHETKMNNGVMEMRAIESLPLKAGTTAELRPGGMHIMFMDVMNPVGAGDTVEAVLDFEHAPDQTVTFEVQSIHGEEQHDEPDHAHMNH